MTSLSAIEIERIKPHASNVRRDLGDLSELAASIKGVGLLQPLTVAPIGDDYLVIAGHRRLAAAKEAGLDVVPCIIRTDLSTQKAQIEAMLVENLQRSDLTVMEEADAYAQLELLGVKEVAIAKATGRARGTIRQRLLLASLPAKRREQFENGQLSLDGAAKCAKLRTQYAEDATILDRIDKAGTWMFSHGQIEREIQRVLEDRKPKPEPVDDEGDDDDVEQTTVDAQIRDQQRAAERERLHGMWKKQATWLEERFTQRADLDDLRMLAQAALDMAVREGDYDIDALTLAGLMVEEDDDGNERVTFTWPEGPLLYCVLVATSTEISKTAPPWISSYGLEARTQWLASIGYEMDAAEQALVAKRASGEAAE